MSRSPRHPLYAVRSLSGGTYTVTYKPTADQSGSCTGYSYDRVLKEHEGSGVPFIDFTTMDFDGWPFPGVKEAYTSFNEMYWPLEKYVAEAKRRGATVTYL